jgi:protein involved in polysaccharide export with SLBB domain
LPRMPSSLVVAPLRILIVSVLTLAPLASGLAAQAPSGQPTAPSLMPGDALALQIWREPDLSGRFIVDEGGIVTLPLLGRIHVTGVPIPELRERLIEGFERQLRNPAITVIPLRRIYVLGEVNRPGLLEVDPTVTLAGAVALAGGANWEGDLRRLQIMRDGVVLDREVGPEADLLSVDIRSGDQIFVGRRPWIERHSTFLVSATIGVASIIVTLLR